MLVDGWLSDEVSEPEDAEAESKEAWKQRMAQSGEDPYNPSNKPLSANNLKSVEFWETVKPAWRSDEVSNTPTSI